jgi:flotillin
MKTARETLEGNLRGVLSTMTPEQVNTDKETFAQRLAAEAEHDLSKLGLVLDTLKIQNVSDEVGYLDAMGRQRSAAIRRDALIAEAASQAQAAEWRWANTRNAELATLESQMQIAAKENERRVADAQSRRGALIAQQQAEVQALIAQATGEVAMQEARIEQVRRRLHADVIQPAEAARRKAEEQAKGAASLVIEQGRATASVLARIAENYNKGGTSSRDVLLMQKLVPLFQRLAGTIGDLKVDRLTILPHRTGDAGGAGLGARLVDANEQVRAVTGVDLGKVLRDKLGDDDLRMPSRPPPAPSR